MATTYPDRPPPHPTSPFRWVWSDQPHVDFGGRLVVANPAPTWFDISWFSRLPADRSAYLRPEGD